jgi:hypothetical protein
MYGHRFQNLDSHIRKVLCTKAEAIRGEKPGMTVRGVELIFLEEDRKRSARGLPVMPFLPKNPIPVKADGVCCRSYKLD